MRYDWRCKDCGELTEVERSLDDYKIPPNNCDHCSSQRLWRVLTMPKRIYVPEL